METFILVAHVLIALVIIGLIMLQQGKGAEMGASFGSGSSQTVFGAVGSGNFFSRLTAILVFVFFITSFTLAVLAKQKAKIDDHFLTPATEVTQPKEAPKTENSGPTAAIPENQVKTENTQPAAANEAPAAPTKPSEDAAGALEVK